MGFFSTSLQHPLEEKAASSRVDCQDILEGGKGTGGGGGVKSLHRFIAIKNR